MKPTRDRRLWVARGVFCLLSVLLLSLPAQALADGVLAGGVGDVIDDVTDSAGQAVNDATEGVGGVVEETTETVGGVVEETTETVGGVVEETTETVGGVVEETTETVGGVVEETTETVGEVIDEADAAVGTVDGAANGVAGSSEAVAVGPSGSSDGHAGGDGTESETATSGSDGVGSGSTIPLGGARWMHREVDRPYFWWDFSGDALGLWVASAQTVEGDSGPNEDPCDADSQLVCLGLLYGLGDFAETPAQVLGFLATTGIGVIALMMVAVGLGVAGSVALVGSRYGTPATVGRTG